VECCVDIASIWPFAYTNAEFYANSPHIHPSIVEAEA
jgi:hypothetical protein